MKIKSFFDNLSVYFEEEEDLDVPIRASVYKNEEGDITEVRIFNPDYNEMLILSANGTYEALSVDELVDANVDKQSQK